MPSVNPPDGRNPARVPKHWKPSRRGFLQALGAVGAASATPWLAGCSSDAAQLVTFYQSKPEAVPHFRDLAAQFTASQSEYRILHDLSTNLSASFVRSNPPDLGMLNYNLEMARFMERGALSDLSDLPEAATIRPDIVELSHAYPQYGDRVSVLPYSAMAAGVIYNKRIFEANNVEVPTTWDALIEVCETLKANGVLPFFGTFVDPWTIMQGWWDYPIGGMVDVTEFYRAMNEAGADVTPESEVSFSSVMLEPTRKMIELTKYTNPDAASRGYGDGNTAFGNDGAAMILQGPWAFSEFAKVNPDQDLGTFPLPATDSADDLKVRVNIDLSLWVPEKSDAKEGARAFLQYLMRPEIQDPYNAAFMGFGTTIDAPAPTDPRITELTPFYDSGAFYMGASQFIPNTIPAANYIQSIALGAAPEPLLAQLDRDWARLAFRA
ncbi:carbohydrate ABC transporter substrate-binding protein, CUT1 family (TC 3.A.1.1.-) [Tessaracoccus bendigoensis DSM 12906]|uniref:Carbohydrate ABC transporter substrate-binding protein, CUT1 family (TC 3.A.1.1.-) n=1 Tax=Tessaracoccus bendigoensis DSM 12906 TaxID=1123357 RepID=A0A1M6C2Q3_9ACTN|nr:substrate-binding domain-containing protein [Tessaracoccus bendigoensis]SHI55296.1 carbohydrate ABC transporter substrate-binding protein, CUT1 family (TC 3.A.1.1.-) [Tessaracoccus bendigoensis DSM 12906]